MTEEIDKENLNPWFAFWKNQYESIYVNSMMSALQYSEFLNVARIFEPDYSCGKLQEYYNGLVKEDLENTDDIYIFYNAVRNIKEFNNINANEAIKLRIDSAIGNNQLFQSEIDIESTARGVLLARNIIIQLIKEKYRILFNKIIKRFP